MDEILTVIADRDKISKRAFVGLDGFVDEVVHVVDRRVDESTFTRIQTIAEYAARIREGSGLSLNIEVVPIQSKLGGNGPIYAYGLKKLDVGITYVGCVGKGTVEPVFQRLAEESRMIGITAPGMTDAMEFQDGKIIRSKLNSLNQLKWEDLIKYLPPEDFAEEFDRADLISLNNWTMIPHMSDIWRHLQKEVLPLMKKEKSDVLMFFDLADPRKRSGEDVLEALELIQGFKKQGFCTVLGLNLKEARLIAGHICRSEEKAQKTEKMDLEPLTHLIADYLQIDGVVVHPVNCAACVYHGKYAEVPGPYCKAPVLTTGAGDVFNSGFTFGLLHKLCPEECLLLGNAASGYYVRNADWADSEALSEFVRTWMQDSLIDDRDIKL